MSGAPEELPAGMKPCRVCAEPIRLAARKCIKCDSYQDWRSAISFSSSILSLLIALISVGTVFLPVLKDFQKVDNSDMVISLQEAREGEVFILASNQGTRSGSIIDGSLEVSSPDKPMETFALFSIVWPINPGESKIVALQIEGRCGGFVLPKESSYIVKVRFNDFFGHRDEISLQMENEIAESLKIPVQVSPCP